jgi:RimJ/RimL family protein N-acetyltransferase
VADDALVTLLPVPPGVTDPTEAAAGRPFGQGYPHAATPIALGYAAIGGDSYLVVDPTGAVVGECGTKGPPSPDGVVEIGYGLAAASQGRGLGTAAVAALIDRLAARPDVRIVEAHVDPANTPSRRLLERLGFSLAGMTEHELVYRAELRG